MVYSSFTLVAIGVEGGALGGGGGGGGGYVFVSIHLSVSLYKRCYRSNYKKKQK